MFVTEFLKKLLLADSICKHLGDLPGVTKKVVRGACIEDFGDLIMSGDLDIKGMDAVLLHIGTNNLARDFNAHAVLVEIGNLIRLIKKINDNIHIVVSGILPRLVDFDVSDRPIKEYNKLLSRVCRDCNVMMIRSFNGFTSGKEPNGIKGWLFARDGLHLSTRGSYILSQLFRVQFSDRNIWKRREVLDDEALKRERRDFDFGYRQEFM
jgi:lysophospholipase L1-like esterase